MRRRAQVTAACFAVLVPVGALLVSHGGGRGAGCAARYSIAGGRLSLAFTLEQAGRVEVRVGGGDIRRSEPSGTSVLTLPGSAVVPGVSSVTEFTGDGQLLVCTLTPGG